MPALSSAILLVLSFPNFNQPWCAWIAFVPWLLLLRTTSSRAAFWWSYLIGALFFLGSMWWLIYVTVVGWLVLCAYLALYFGIFGWCVVRHQTSDIRHQGRFVCGLRSGVRSLIVIPALWVTLEFARSHVLTGMGWNLLAYSQTSWRPLIQFADLTGAWGISFLIVMGNAAIADYISTTVWGRGRARPDGSNRRAGGVGGGKRTQSVLIRAACVMILVLIGLGYGAWRISSIVDASSIRVAVAQGNIPQTEKWDEAFQERILTQYETLTREAARTEPDLIVWPETSVPGYFGLDEEITQRVFALAKSVKAPLLVGAPMGHLDGVEWMMTNSAALVDHRGVIDQRYDKLHLVPFGEFVPFERTLPWLRRLLPPIGDFDRGHHHTVFHIEQEADVLGRGARDEGRGKTGFPTSPVSRPLPPFSVLICFEDVFPELARRFVQEGARMLVVITNDAWFGPTAAAYQHAQTSIFRAVELRVPVVRAANTGWSGCIDPAGRILGSVHDEQGRELFIAGTHACDVPLSYTRTLYERWGDWFAWACLIGILGWMIARLR
ncbi:MAG: apolipoprotein N-acyltransferase [Candidatus Omnitrophica bacterium]|nr:apolipoprotein N-acyltransferase [Candidatus Omnitrophota bacterium]